MKLLLGHHALRRRPDYTKLRALPKVKDVSARILWTPRVAPDSQGTMAGYQYGFRCATPMV